MPIRFRCAYCNQLMGIASRKAGSVVRCPKCAGEIIVPSPEGVQPAADPTDQAVAPLVFEDLKFDQLLNVPPNGSAAAPTISTPAPADDAGVLPAPVLTPLPRKRLGLFLPLGMLIVSMAVVILLLILVFILGILLGKQMGTPDVKTAGYYVCLFV